MTFTPNLKVVSQNPQRLAAGHRMCPGCGLAVILRQILTVTNDPVIVVNATGCLEICTSAYPYSSWRAPWIHSLFENAAAVASGIAAYKKALERKGKLKDAQKRLKVVAVGGDGATYDIGLQAISGALERQHDFIYICLDNEGYMNTGHQRSSATPFGAATTTTPDGKVLHGKQTPRKDLAGIITAHHIPYFAEASPSHFADLMLKANKAFTREGPSFLNILSPCPTNWKSATEVGMTITKAAVETNFWPLFEVEDGQWKVNYKPTIRKPIEDWLTGQKRFKHLLKPENAGIKNQLQQEIDERWAELLKRENLPALKLP